MNTPDQLAEQLASSGIIDNTQAQALRAQHSPWWLQLMQGFAAWIAALLIISSVLGPLFALSEANTIRVVLAVLMLLAAVYLAARPAEFLRYMSVAVALAAQGLLVYVAAELFRPAEDAARYSCIIISSLLLFTPLNSLHQRISLGFALLCVLSFMQQVTVLAVMGALLLAASLVLWSNRPRWSSRRYALKLRSLLELCTLGALALAFVSQCISNPDYSYWLKGDYPLARQLSSGLNAALLAGYVIWLSRQATVPSRLAIAVFTLLLCLLLFNAPALLVATALMLACFYASAVRWFMLTVLAQIAALSQFYYSLQLSLLHKAGLLALAAVLLFCGWLLIQRYQRRQV